MKALNRADDRIERQVEAAELEERAEQSIQRVVDFQQSLTQLQVPGERTRAGALGYGWWLRCVRTGAAINKLRNEGFGHEASPLVRTVLHHVAALAWLRLDPEEVLAAVVFDHQQRRQHLGQKALAREWDLAGMKLGPPPNKSDRPANLDLLKLFERMCERIKAPNLYVAYLVESGYVHPSGVSADTYVEPAPDGGIRLRGDSVMPGVPLREVAMFLGAGTKEFGLLIDDTRFQEVADQMGDLMETSVDLRGEPE